MAKQPKPPGGVKAAEPPPTPAAETPPVTETPAETPATPATALEAAPTPEEIEAQVEEMAESLFAPVNSGVNAKIQAEREAEADKPKAADEPAADLPQSDAPGGGEKPEGSEEPKLDDEPKPAEAQTAGERFVPGAMTPEEVKETARLAAREEIQSQVDDQPAPEPPVVPRGTIPTDAGLSDEAQDQLIVLNEMAALNPAHRDLPQRQREFWKKEDQHRARWEQANPGTAYDSNSQDHAEFYRKNEPFVPMRDFKAAERSIISREAEERAVNRVRKEQEPRLREIELKERERETAPRIAAAMADAAEEIFASAPQFKDAFEPGKLTKTEFEKMEEINPALAQIAREEAEVTAVLVGELEKLDRLQGHYPVNPAMRHRLSNGQTIAPHAVLEVEFAETEAALLSKPEAERTRDGKKLITFDHAMTRAQRIKTDPKLRPEQKQRALEDLAKTSWWVQSADVAKHIRSKKAARVGEFAQRFTKTTQPPAKTTTSNGHPTGAPSEIVKPAVTPSKPSGKAGLPRGTSTASSSDTSDNAPRGQSEIEKAQEYLEKAAFR